MDRNNRYWNSLVRLLLIAQERGDRAACLVLAGVLRSMAGIPCPKPFDPLDADRDLLPLTVTLTASEWRAYVAVSLAGR